MHGDVSFNSMIPNTTVTYFLLACNMLLQEKNLNNHIIPTY
jgi:hypothetical protein